MSAEILLAAVIGFPVVFLACVFVFGILLATAIKRMDEQARLERVRKIDREWDYTPRFK